MIVAIFTTRNFTFTAFGKKHRDAGEAIVKGLHEHGNQRGLEKDWFKFDKNDNYTYQDFIDDNVTFLEAKEGMVYRDSSVLIK